MGHVSPHTPRLRGRGILLLLGVWAAMGLSACGTLREYRTPGVDFSGTALKPATIPATAPTVMPPPTVGAIYNAQAYRPLFEDYRARLPGDTLVVQIIEKVSAIAKSNSTVDKSGEVNAEVKALLGLKSNTLNKLGASGSSANSFEGKGATENTNDFTGTITAVVTGVLPNGHLLIAGEKQIGVNANVDVLRFSGQVDPRAIQPGNVVESNQVASVRVEHRGRGQQADAQVMGLLGRFFLSVLPI